MNISYDPIKISFIKMHEDARLPVRNNKQLHTGDTGYDIYAIEDAFIPANSTANVPVGLEIGYIEPRYWIRIESRSGMFFKNGITAFPGVIDCSYRGRLGVALINNTESGYNVKKFDRIAQLVVYKLIEPEISWVESKDSTSRGENGFGSSGR
jgi:dUTP pyrophosphatase